MDKALTYRTESSHPKAMDTGIIAIQNSVSHPFTLRIKTGSPCTDAHNERMAFTLWPARGEPERDCEREETPVVLGIDPVETHDYGDHRAYNGE